MDLQASATRKARVTPGTNGQAQKQRGFAAVFSGSQTGNTPGTTGNKPESAGRICSRCDPLFQVPGTAETRAVTGCSRCSRCDPAKQQHRSGGFQRLKPPEPAPRLGCSLFFGVQKWRATLHRRTRSISLQAAPFLGCSGLRCSRAQFAQFAHMYRAQAWKPRGAWAAGEFAARAGRPPRGVKECESARSRALNGEGAQPCASA